MSAVIVRALYRLESEDPLLRTNLTQCLQKQSYHSYDADPNLWIKAHYRFEDKLQYYSFMVSYLNYIL